MSIFSSRSTTWPSGCCGIRAQDATQEILIRVITHLGSFRGDSRLQTWVFRVAANYLITARQSRVEAQGFTFDRFANELHDGLAEVVGEEEWPPDKALLPELLESIRAALDSP